MALPIFDEAWVKRPCLLSTLQLPYQPPPSIHLAILCNPLAGKGRALILAREICSRLSMQSVGHTLFDHQWPESIDRYSAIWLVGGDGTLNRYVNQYKLADNPVALFKGGTGNDFAWKLYGDLEFDAYYNKALQAIARPVDLGICNGRYFVNGVGIGFDAEVVRSMSHTRAFVKGHLRYLAAVLRQIFGYRESQMALGNTALLKWERFFMCTIANGSRYGGGFLVAPQALIDDGLLDVLRIGPVKWYKRLYLSLIHI